MDLYGEAERAGIRIAPGPMFSPSHGYSNFIRLNTGFPWSESTERQMSTLGRLVADRG
jgi:DNA-binding transcriptional MocR family regulator